MFLQSGFCDDITGARQILRKVHAYLIVVIVTDFVNCALLLQWCHDIYSVVS